MTTRRSAATLCLLSSVFALLTVTVKQYELIWWAGCIIAAFAGTIIVMRATEIHEPNSHRLLKASVVIVPVIAIALGLLTGHLTSH